ncbi:MAG: Ig-like domain-containing protein, partial [Ignavibacteria bacterium]
APKVIRTFPENGTLKYNKNYVEFEFSEYINKRSITNAIFVSPYFNEEIEQKWSGKRLRLIFPEKLREDKTYVISLGTDISDLRGNKLDETFTLTFSTGSKIDQGIISGRVYDNKPEGIFIFFYLIDSFNQFVDYTNTKPDFICQTSKDGSFVLSGLPQGIFRIVAVNDQMRNLIYDVNEDEIGLPFKDYQLNDTSRIIRNVQFEMRKIDTLKPAFNSIRLLDLNHLLLNFNEPIDFSSIDLQNFVIYDSLETEKIYPVGFFSNDKNSLILATQTLKGEKDYFIRLSGIKDLAGNQIDSVIQSFFTEKILDTSPINFKSIQGNFSTSTVEYFNPEISINFNDIVPLENFLDAFSISDTSGRKLNFEIHRPDSASFIVRLEPLKQKEKLILKVNLELLVDLSGNKIDSLYSKTFETNSDADYGSISGFVKNKIDIDKTVIIEAKSLNSSKVYSLKTREEKYQIKNIPPGNYFLKLSIEDQSSKNDYRSFSNPFIYHQDTIKVKSRWPTTDVNFNLEELFR